MGSSLFSEEPLLVPPKQDGIVDGGVGRELGRGNPEPGGGKVAFPGDVLDFAPTRDQIAAHVYVVLEGRPPRPEPRPRRLLADASRKGLLTGDGRGEKVHLGFAVGTDVALRLPTNTWSGLR